MATTRLRFAMIGFIVGVLLVYFLKDAPISTGLRIAAPIYLFGVGIIIDGIVLRIKERKGKDE
ncbi:hypothetical protein ACTID9_04655 [Brevibacillus fluminis]|uniref:hypothetical protein n=1 Tax=Brevibacillus fluminis TaxID=511487 RepID=UPI003F8CBAD1